MESSDDEDDDEEEEGSVPYTAEDIRTMNYGKLRELCGARHYNLFNKDMPRADATVPQMKEALMNKFGLKGSNLSDWQQKVEETNQAMAAFLLLPVVVAITSKIRNFNPKNTAHAKSFLKQYKEQHGKSLTRS